MVQNLSIINMGAQNIRSQNFPVLLSCQNTRFPLLRWLGRLLRCYAIISTNLRQHHASASLAKLERRKKCAFTRLNKNEKQDKKKPNMLSEQSSLKLHQSYFLISVRHLYRKVHTRDISTKIKLLISTIHGN